MKTSLKTNLSINGKINNLINNIFHTSLNVKENKIRIIISTRTIHLT